MECEFGGCSSSDHDPATVRPRDIDCIPDVPLCDGCYAWVMGRITCPFHGDDNC